MSHSSPPDISTCDILLEVHERTEVENVDRPTETEITASFYHSSITVKLIQYG